jgi:hypothetical protein
MAILLFFYKQFLGNLATKKLKKAKFSPLWKKKPLLLAKFSHKRNFPWAAGALVKENKSNRKFRQLGQMSER